MRLLDRPPPFAITTLLSHALPARPPARPQVMSAPAAPAAGGGGGDELYDTCPICDKTFPASADVMLFHHSEGHGTKGGTELACHGCFEKGLAEECKTCKAIDEAIDGDKTCDKCSVPKTEADALKWVTVDEEDNKQMCPKCYKTEATETLTFIGEDDWQVGLPTVVAMKITPEMVMNLTDKPHKSAWYSQVPAEKMVLLTSEQLSSLIKLLPESRLEEAKFILAFD